MMMSPAVLVSFSIRRTTTRSFRGRNFMGRYLTLSKVAFCTSTALAIEQMVSAHSRRVVEQISEDTRWHCQGKSAKTVQAVRLRRAREAKDGPSDYCASLGRSTISSEIDTVIPMLMDNIVDRSGSPTQSRAHALGRQCCGPLLAHRRGSRGAHGRVA